MKIALIVTFVAVAVVATWWFSGIYGNQIHTLGTGSRPGREWWTPNRVQAGAAGIGVALLGVGAVA